MKLQEILQRTINFFKEKKIESARLDAEILISEALGLKRIDLYVKFEYPLSEVEIQKCREFVRRRSLGEPVAYIIERRDFYNLSFKVQPGVLIPRPETEHIIEEALAWVKRSKKESTELRILDMGFGSGCIALTLAHELKNSHVTGLDISDKAYAIALENSQNLKIENINLVKTSVQDFQFSESYDIIVANPPYIAKDDPEVQKSVAEFEPAEALFSDENGLKDLRVWAEKSASYLKQPGIMIFEMGYKQANEMRTLFESLGFQHIRIGKDLAGLDRYIVAERI